MLAARLAWAAVFALLLANVVASLAGPNPHHRVGDEWLVRRTLPAVYPAIDLEAFYLYLLVLRYATLAIFWLVALLIFWKRSGDWVALLVSWVLLLTPFSLVLGEEEGSPEGPKVTGDPTTRKLWVRGTSAQISQIRDLVEKLEGPDAEAATSQRGNVRMLPYTGRAAQNALDYIEAFWPQLRANRIRVVTPSQ